MMYCSVCTFPMLTDDIGKNIVNTPIATNIFQCPNCFVFQYPTQAVDFDKPCRKCGRSDETVRIVMECNHWFCFKCVKLTDKDEESVFICDVCNNSSSTVPYTISHRRLNIPDKFKPNYRKLYVQLIDMIESYLDDIQNKHEITLVALEEYHRWLNLLVRYGGAHILSPGAFIDKIWHMHILDTENYADTCEKLCGKFIHHYPENSFVGQKDERLDRYNNTMTFYRERYGLMSPDVEKIWALKGLLLKFYRSKATGVIHIKRINGFVFDLPFVKDATVRNLKEMINEMDGVCINDQRLIYAGHNLDDGVLLSKYGIYADATLHMVLRVSGC